MLIGIIQCNTKIDLKGLPQNDPSLIDAIKKEFLIEPDISKPYNLANDLTLSKAQFGQDDAVFELFKGKQNGFFIEAGAYDGETYSNSLKFELKLNWTGVLVEPNPDNFESLLTKNRRAYAIKTCLSPKSEVTEVSFDAAGISGGIINGKFKPGDEAQKAFARLKRDNKNFKPKFPYERRTIEMQCLPLTSIIEAVGNPTIDYLSLDIEGVEIQVLRSLPFEKLDIKVISIETNHIRTTYDGSSTNLDFLLRRNGYTRYKSVGVDEIYVKNEFMNAIKDEL